MAENSSVISNEIIAFEGLGHPDSVGRSLRFSIGLGQWLSNRSVSKGEYTNLKIVTVVLKPGRYDSAFLDRLERLAPQLNTIVENTAA